MAKTKWSYDRPRFYALVISALTGAQYKLPSVESWSFQKSDDGASGHFSIRVPMRAEYEQIVKDGKSETELYAHDSSPMDLVAFYAQRQMVSDDGTHVAEPIIPIPYTSNGTFNWGDDDAVTVTALGTPNCIFIGMLDGTRVSGSPGGEVMLTLTGRDLTKIFEVNYTGIPDSVAAAPEGGKIGNSVFFQFIQLALTATYNGGAFLIAALDLLCWKQTASVDALLAPDDPLLTKIKNANAAQARALYESFGFNYHNFIRLDAFNYAYRNLKGTNYGSYAPQLGPVWSSIMELRNAPISRLFVNELGQLIYDDQLGAWSGTCLDGSDPLVTSPIQYGAVAGTIGPEDVREFEFAMDDSTMVTFLSVFGNAGTQSLGTNGQNIQYFLGLFQEGSGFLQNGGMIEAASASAAHVSTFGYRYGQFESQWDLTLNEGAQRRKVIVWSHNNLNTASVTLRGRPYYRVGQRYNLMLDGQRDDISNQPWYIASIEHSGTWGEDWTTTLELRYPPFVPATPTLAGGPSTIAPSSAGIDPVG